MSYTTSRLFKYSKSPGVSFKMNFTERKWPKISEENKTNVYFEWNEWTIPLKEVWHNFRNFYRDSLRAQKFQTLHNFTE